MPVIQLALLLILSSKPWLHSLAPVLASRAKKLVRVSPMKTRPSRTRGDASTGPPVRKDQRLLPSESERQTTLESADPMKTAPSTMAAVALTAPPVLKRHFSTGASGMRAGLTPLWAGSPRNIGQELPVAARRPSRPPAPMPMARTNREMRIMGVRFGDCSRKAMQRRRVRRTRQRAAVGYSG